MCGAGAVESIHCRYEYVTQVGANDMYDGMTAAASMFIDYTILRFEEVKQLHIILLVVSLVLIFGFVAKVWHPYVRKLHTESKALAGMMSLLPSEVDIESHVKSVVLGITKNSNGNSMRSASMMGGANIPADQVAAFRAGGSLPGNGSMPGGSLLRLLPPPGAGGMPPAGGYGGAPAWGSAAGGGGMRGQPQWE